MDDTTPIGAAAIVSGGVDGFARLALEAQAESWAGWMSLLWRSAGWNLPPKDSRWPSSSSPPRLDSVARFLHRLRQRDAPPDEL